MSKLPRVRTSTGATVTVTIELSGLGSWGPNCTLDQVYRQAEQAALGRIRKAFEGCTGGIRILGPVSVKAITTDTERRPCVTK